MLISPAPQLLQLFPLIGGDLRVKVLSASLVSTPCSVSVVLAMSFGPLVRISCFVGKGGLLARVFPMLLALGVRHSVSSSGSVVCRSVHSEPFVQGD